MKIRYVEGLCLKHWKISISPSYPLEVVGQIETFYDFYGKFNMKSLDNKLSCKYNARSYDLE